MPAVLPTSTPNMQSLLSQSESNAFQSFLSSIDHTEDAISADEWAAFSATSASIDHSYSDDDILQNSEGRQALTKATKDLMSLDTADGNWDDPNDTAMLNHSPVIHPHFDGHETHQYDQQQGHRYQQESHGVNSYPSRHDSFPFLRSKFQQQPPSQPLQFPMQLQHHPVSPLTTGSSELRQRSPRSSYSFSQQQQLHIRRDASPGTRPKRSHTLPSPSASSARPSSDSHKRRRLSPSESSTPATTSAELSRLGHSSSNPRLGPQQRQPSKSNLLSPSQKKANHIQSEQKRRANIRRGYAALCETVPALREAIREEEEAERAAAASPNTTGVVNGDGFRTNGAGKKKRNKKGNGKDPDDQDKDGRAGPRSENMVLSKSM